jgi:hypothetical protein
MTRDYHESITQAFRPGIKKGIRITPGFSPNKKHVYDKFMERYGCNRFAGFSPKVPDRVF